tara:strand:- start:66 stop:329 length:264 start_codon:yes stop_codon:yes gene_type:complete
LLLSLAEPGGGFETFSRPEKEVLICHSGSWNVEWTAEKQKGSFVLEAGDLFSLPAHVGRSIECVGKQEGSIYFVINKDSPKSPNWIN